MLASALCSSICVHCSCTFFVCAFFVGLCVLRLHACFVALFVHLRAFFLLFLRRLFLHRSCCVSLACSLCRFIRPSVCVLFSFCFFVRSLFVDLGVLRLHVRFGALFVDLRALCLHFVGFGASCSSIW